jgi:hypothetical protein
MSLAALMVHVHEHDSNNDRFPGHPDWSCGWCAMAGLHGRRCWPEQVQPIRLSKGDGALRAEGQEVSAQAHCLRQIEWRSALECPGQASLAGSTSADLLIIGRTRGWDGVILLSGRPVLVAPDTFSGVTRELLAEALFNACCHIEAPDAASAKLSSIRAICPYTRPITWPVQRIRP